MTKTYFESLLTALFLFYYLILPDTAEQQIVLDYLLCKLVFFQFL